MYVARPDSSNGHASLSSECIGSGIANGGHAIIEPAQSDVAWRGLNLGARADVIVFRLDLSLRYLSITPAIEQLTNLGWEDFLGKTVFDLRSTLYDPEGLAMKAREAIETRTSVQREFCVAGRQYRTRLIPESGPDGAVQSLLGVTEDITSQTMTEIALRQTREQYYSLLHAIDGIVWELDYETWKFTFVSQQAERLLGYPIERWLNDASFWTDHLHPEDRDRTIEKCVYLSERNENHELEYRMIRADGQSVWLRDIVTVEQRGGRTVRLRGVKVDITEIKEEEALRRGQSRILEMIAVGAPLGEILERVVLLIESHSPATCCGVLLLAEDGIHVSQVIAPNLPDSYETAVLGRAIGPREGSCGAAMYHKRRVITADVGSDPLWENDRDLATAQGVKACWSTPILTPRGKVLGAFGMHCAESRAPSAAEERLADVAAHLASIAIERQRAEESLRRSEAALRESEERSQATLRAIPDLIFVFSDEGEYLACHAKSDEELLLPVNQLLGRKLSEIVPRDLAQAYLDAFRKAAESEEPQTLEYDLVVRGRMRRTESRVVRIGKGKFLALVRNVTESKRAEAALRESEERFRLVSLATRDAVYDLNVRKGTVWRNKSFHQLYSPDCPISMDFAWWRDRIHPDDQARILRGMEEAFREQRQFWSGEYLFRRSDGTFATVMDRGYIIYDAGGEPVRMIGAITDISAHKESERALRASEERYRNVVETQTEMICRCLPDTTLTFVNEAYARHFGKPPGELIGKSYLELLPEAERGAVREVMMAVLEGRYSGPTEFASLQSDGSTRWTQWFKQILRDDKGGIEIQSIGRDITEQKQAAEALRKSQEELRRSHAQIRYLAGCLMKAHEEERRRIARELHDDLNQQIAGLSISLSNIKRQLPPSADTVVRELGHVQERAKSIANGIRSLSHELHPVALEYAGLVPALKSMITEFSGSRAVDFSLRVPESSIAVPDEIAICIYRVAQESVRNIIKHSAARHADVELSIDEACINLSVTDDGCGFETDHTRRPGGLGLISMAERVGLMQGVFELRSKRGEGTSLRVAVPLKSEQQ